MRDYRKIWHGPLEKLDIPFYQLESGDYLAEGRMTPAVFYGWCSQQGFVAEGALAARLELALAPGMVDISGTLDVTLTRTCVRTLKPFTEHHSIPLTERLLLDHTDETELTLTEKSLALGPYVLEHLLLRLEPYPLHPSVRHLPRGGVVWQDQQDAPLEKNPFSVLKDLQSSPKSGKSAPRLKHKRGPMVALKKAS